MRSEAWSRAPRRDATPEIRWVLLRAFADPSAAFSERIDGAQVAAVAADLGLVERIVARVPPSIFAADLGRKVSRELALARLQTMARMQGVCDFIPELAAAVSAASIPVVLLKFAALRVGGYLSVGSRAAGDIDVLVPARDVEGAAEILRRRGFFAAESTMAEHHLPALHDREGRVVELHTRLPGLREPGGRRFAGFEALQRAGALEPAPGLADGCYLMRPDFLAAHAIAHGLAHHGGADVYPVTRPLADVIDVLPGNRRAAGLASAEWIADDVPASDLDAVLGLCDGLEHGEIDDLLARPETGAEAALLQHVLASSLDLDYRRSLVIGYLLHSLSDEPRWWRLLRTIQSRVLPTKAQLAARLGLPSTRSVDLRLRMSHAASLARRLPGLARAALHFARRRVKLSTGRAPAFLGARRSPRRTRT